MPKPVCVACMRFFKPAPTGNGWAVLEQMPAGHGEAPAGDEKPEAWRPYKLWIADKMVCHGCGTEIVVGFAAQPLSEHYKADFAAKVERVRHRMATVNDC